MPEPLISVLLDDNRLTYQPGDVLRGEYRIDALDPADLKAIELSILWYTEGKGDEDLAVHYFERLTDEAEPDQPLHELRRFQTTLPNSPLSYEGVLVKVRWCVRVRVFVHGGKSHLVERAFQLGEIPYAQTVPA